MIALLLITLILVTQFNSLLVPFIIMTTVILSLIGVLLGLLICDLPFGIIMTGIGVISLAGVVVNNAIVLLDYTRQVAGTRDGPGRRGGRGRRDAPAPGAADRRHDRHRPDARWPSGICYDFHTFTWATKSESTRVVAEHGRRRSSSA